MSDFYIERRESDVVKNYFGTGFDACVGHKLVHIPLTLDIIKEILSPDVLVEILTPEVMERLISAWNRRSNDEQTC